MTHTPGPWEYAELLADGVIIKRGGAFEIRTPNYDVCTVVPGRAPIRKEDDARLIAAAPELLAACELALQWANVDHPEGSFLQNQLRAAISKAKGA